jgi:hypothetical protein
LMCPYVSSSKFSVLAPLFSRALHQKIKRVFICRSTQHYISYKALYDIKIICSCYVVQSLSDIYMFLKGNIFWTTYSVQQHIILNHIFCSTTCFCYSTYIYGLYVKFVQIYIYVFKQHIYVIEFYRTYVFHVSLNNMYVILM